MARLPRRAASLGTFAAAAAAAAALLRAPFASAQDGGSSGDDGGVTETVWAAILVTTYGDRIPLVSPDYSVLTPLGADQMFSAGDLFRSRYVSPPSNSSSSSSSQAGSSVRTIDGISQYQVDNRQIDFVSSPWFWIEQSMQAFLAGLYPPLETSTPNGSSFLVNSASELANGSMVAGPLGGFQFPQTSSPSFFDPNSTWVAGSEECDAQKMSVLNLSNSSDFLATFQSTQGFYEDLAPLLNSTIKFMYNLNFGSAYEIWDYLSYQFLHDPDTAKQLNQSTIDQLRFLADQLVWQENGNYTVDSGIRSIAGKTLAARILASLENNIYSLGQNSKLTSMLTSFEPVVSLASLMGLTDFHPEFYGMPNLGSSMIFELFTNSSAFNPGAARSGGGSDASMVYPDPSKLMVRFLFRNGTNSTSNINEYAIFGNNDHQFDMTFADFADKMASVQIPDVETWCSSCGSSSIYCVGADGLSGTGGLGLLTPKSNNDNSGPITPVIAGVIGAMVTLGVVALLLAAAFVLGGVRLSRKGRDGPPTKRRSELGGFKGSEKLASDPDLPRTDPAANRESGTTIGASVVPAPASPTSAEGEHRRVESWEMKHWGDSNGNKGTDNRPSFERDRDVMAQGQPIKVVENV